MSLHKFCNQLIGACIILLKNKYKEEMERGQKNKVRVYLGSAYFAETENFLLKVP